jgi:hypothetical protein
VRREKLLKFANFFLKIQTKHNIKIQKVIKE